MWRLRRVWAALGEHSGPISAIRNIVALAGVCVCVGAMAVAAIHVIVSDGDGPADDTVDSPSRTVAAEASVVATGGGALDPPPSGGTDGLGRDTTATDGAPLEPVSSNGANQPLGVPISDTAPVSARIDRADRLIEAGQPRKALEVLEAIEPHGVDDLGAIALARARALAVGSEEGAMKAHETLISAIAAGADQPSLHARAELYRYIYDPSAAAERIYLLSQRFPRDADVAYAHAFILNERDPGEASLDAAKRAAELARTLPSSLQQRRMLAQAAYWQGLAHRRIGEVHEAVSKLREAYAEEEATSEWRVIYGLELVSALRGANDDDAIREALRVLDELKRFPAHRMTALRVSGDILVQHGQVADGLRAIYEAIEMEDGEVSVAPNHTSLARALDAAGRPLTEVEVELDIAKRLAPDWAQPYLDHAEILNRRDSAFIERALELARVAAEKDVRSVSAHLWVCYLERLTGDVEQADVACLRAHELAPESPDVLRQRAYVAESRSDYGQALELWNQILAHDATNMDALIGACYAKSWGMAPSTEAVESCEVAIEAASKHRSTSAQRRSAIKLHLGHAHRVLGNVGAAHRWLREYVREEPVNEWGWIELARLHRVVPGVPVEEIRGEFEKALTLPFAADEYADFLRSFDPEESARIYESVIASDGVTAERLTGLAASTASFDQATATEIYRKALEHDADLASKTAAAIGLDKQVIISALEAVSDPDNARWNERLAMAREAVGGTCDNRSRELLERSIQLESHDRRSRVQQLAWCLYRAKDMKAMEALVDRELVIDRASGLYLRGWWYYDSLFEFDPDGAANEEPIVRAVADLRAAITLDPEFYSPYEGLAFIFSHRPEVMSARDFLDVWRDIRERFGTWAGSLETQIRQTQSLLREIDNGGMPRREADELKASLEEALRQGMEKEPDSAFLMSEFGLHFEDVDGPAAEKALRRAVANDARDARVFEALARRVDDPKESAMLFAAAAKIDAGNPRLWELAGRANFDARDWAAAEWCYQSGLQTEGRRAALEWLLAELYALGFDGSRRSDVGDHALRAASIDRTYADKERVAYLAGLMLSDVSSDHDARVIADVVAALVESGSEGVGEDPSSAQAQRIPSRELMSVAYALMESWPAPAGYEAALVVLEAAAR